MSKNMWMVLVLISVGIARGAVDKTVEEKNLRALHLDKTGTSRALPLITETQTAKSQRLATAGSLSAERAGLSVEVDTSRQHCQPANTA
jgi:hypothetical protein